MIQDATNGKEKFKNGHKVLIKIQLLFSQQKQ
jgi:hypothetical protein